jgi:uncharacterized protein YdaU (DUF1376 family)
MTPQEIDQLTRDSWYLCSFKHGDYFLIWNMYYTKVDKENWDRVCMFLMALMCVDGTARPPK